MKVLPIRYSDDIEALATFYGLLGLEANTRSRGGGWIDLRASGGLLGLHISKKPEIGACELSFETDERLEDLLARLHAAGRSDAHIIDEAFGRSLRVPDPDGVAVQINESDSELYTERS